MPDHTRTTPWSVTVFSRGATADRTGLSAWLSRGVTVGVKYYHFDFLYES